MMFPVGYKGEFGYDIRPKDWLEVVIVSWNWIY